MLRGAEACAVWNNRFRVAILFAVQLSHASAIDIEHNDIADSQPGSGIGVGEGSRFSRVAFNHLVRSGGRNIPGARHGPAIGIFLNSSDTLVDHNRVEDSGSDGIGVDSSTDNLIVANDCRRSGADGIHVTATSSANHLIGNTAFANGDVDARDDNRAANLWLATHCKTDIPAGTICP